MKKSALPRCCTYGSRKETVLAAIDSNYLVFLAISGNAIRRFICARIYRSQGDQKNRRIGSPRLDKDYSFYNVYIPRPPIYDRSQRGSPHLCISAPCFAHCGRGVLNQQKPRPPMLYLRDPFCATDRNRPGGIRTSTESDDAFRVVLAKASPVMTDRRTQDIGGWRPAEMKRVSLKSCWCDCIPRR